MKMKIKELIKHIVSEVVNSLNEGHQTGEWWIDDSGDTIYADGDVGDSGHEAIVIQMLSREILSHFGIDVDECGFISDYEEAIGNLLIADGRLSDEEQEEWNKNSPSEIILRKLIEDNVFKTPEQAEDALYISYNGSSSRDARDYAMKYWRWKVMKSFHGRIEIQSWALTPDDLGIIVHGVNSIMDDYDEDPEDPDKEIGEDGFPGPRLNITVSSQQRRFHGVPLAAIEKKLPSILLNYRSGLHSDFRENVNEDYHHHHPEYRMYEGHDKIITVFEDNSRLFFDVHYHEKRGLDKEKHRKQALSKWRSLANELHRDIQLSDAGNPIQKTWKECFQEALEDPTLEEFIRTNHHQKVFGDR